MAPLATDSVPRSSLTTVRSGGGFPERVLLDKTGRIAADRNATTAEAETSEGRPVAVSFWLVDAPEISSFSVDCPGLPEKDYHHGLPPFIICAEGRFVLFCVVLNVPRWKSFHLFLYTASSSEEPSLHLLPEPADCVVERFEYQNFAILPSSGGADRRRDYAVAFLDWKWNPHDNPCPQYYVNVFSSETRSWTRRKALLDVPESEKALLQLHEITKQIAVGTSSLAWVDLVRGIILLSDLFEQQPVVRHIPFPASRFCFADTDDDGLDSKISVEYFRDVACCDGLIKFVEIDFDDYPDCRSNGSAWKATTWNMEVSWNGWRKRCTVDVDGISVDSSYSAILPMLSDEHSEQLKLKNLIFLVPTLSMQDDDLLYIMAKVDYEDDTAWVIAVDMKHASVEALALVTEPSYSSPMYYPCAFPKYLSDMTPGTPKDYEKPGYTNDYKLLGLPQAKLLPRNKKSAGHAEQKSHKRKQERFDNPSSSHGDNKQELALGGTWSSRCQRLAVVLLELDHRWVYFVCWLVLPMLYIIFGLVIPFIAKLI
ncbi:uncharacterized protein LOC100841721 [Brachypodium distachyon]|uniref:DUF1618 domain-containing protein n=1 Tax=Brachypodium distachyon TaxID=15368 RepID=A0A0Q3FWS7_BRADI|nr:uncharacterized protein LOC100841721 [Brachypodium distachyon]KQK02653.1 hypothetical protein BRADI_2g02860v3 [Brachypodium distachyon]|eukprot:XP_003565326.1 uncharacterized protein LOC100841721 [Brachypodium distachyon]